MTLTEIWKRGWYGLFTFFFCILLFWAVLIHKISGYVIDKSSKQLLLLQEAE